MACGCSGGGALPELAKVQGTVTLDGKPLEDAEVYFIPTFEARGSIGRTNGEGVYSLKFDDAHTGAAVGEHSVRIATRQASPGSEPQPERVPEKYNVKSELKVDVAGGENVLDFDLQSK